MAIKHSLVTAQPDDPEYDVSADEWNAPHVIDDATLTLAKIVNIATARILGRLTAGSGVIEELTAAQVASLLGVGAATDLHGDGSDGNLNFDGASTVTLAGGTNIVPSGGAYTLPRDVWGATVTLSNTATILENGFGLFASVEMIGPASGTATISRKGNNAVNSSAGLVGAVGAALSAGRLPGSGAGGAGVNANTAGNAAGGITGCAQGYTGSGGAGGAGTGGAGGAGGTTAEALAVSNGWRLAFCAIAAKSINGSNFTVGPGGGGGGGNTGSPSGSGGGGGAWAVVSAPKYTNAANIVVDVRGGNGGNAHNGGGNAGGGGGGKGGVAVVLVSGANPFPTILFSGGTGGAGVGTGGAGVNGTDGIQLPLRV